MAKVLAVGDILSVQLYCKDSGQATINTFFYRIGAIGTPSATDADFAAQWEIAVATPIKAMISNLATFRGVGAQVIWPLPVYVRQYSNALAGVGTGGAIAMPKQVSGLTSWRTALAGRLHRGRTYWPFPSTTSDSGDGIATATYTTNMTTLSNAILNFTTFVASTRSATAELDIWNRKAHTTTPVTGAVINVQFATQRRRGDFGRLNNSPI